MLLGKVHAPQELGVYPLKRFVSDAVSVPFGELVAHGVVLGLGPVCATAEVPGTEKERAIKQCFKYFL